MIHPVIVVLVISSLSIAPVTAQEVGTTTGTGQATPTVQPSTTSSGPTTITGEGGGHGGVSQPRSISTTGKVQEAESGKKVEETKKKEKKKPERKHTHKAGLQGLTRSLRELRYYALVTAVGLATIAVIMGYGLVKFERRLSQQSMGDKAQKAEKAQKEPPKVERKLRKTEPEEEEVEKVRKLWEQLKEGD
ncbi:hypothetical protein [Methanopyrus sp.]